MNETSSTALADLAYALHDSCRRFTPPLHPCPETVTKLIKAGTKFLDARDSAPKVPRPLEPYEIKGFVMFQQTWSSTALGFGGMGGAAMTTANVVVVMHHGEACVYFGRRFAYRVRHCPELAEDIAVQRLASVAESKKYQTP